ncbi:MAG: nicotinate (nicotinamide) nucleotide adenylyltransferase [Rhodothermaceae bacterium]|nr:nicotinate (nicotinamide) nucleotide adenylyltransferase [Rhodothermaceae bacterium]MXW33593.1 nicotinate (nicotinamide) nucleotide adenylyltransferase [Rhodothermaceae bacterium]MXX97508.1 nicotinate (nicotinamide) nucleotide adenylyltransferase [Rhodothermaceae bacterium]MXZ17068.1 nicotinate (nicotinamide) nucleotide adenylyltransferase [Rhodothermaceae bacterium]MXZ58329.1 nicotinate (nicotinamide) nucleotide adenylyltransferase [Rhodothermaceae bacterium]
MHPMKVGIFGGSFNPPHIAHSIVAETIRSQFNLDVVLWVPTYAPPHKSTIQLTPYKYRLGMVRAAVAEHSFFQVSDIEKTLDSPTYTIRMLGALRKRYPDAEFNLVLGGDSLAYFDTWTQPEEIAKEVKLLVYPRMNYPVTYTALALPDYLSGRVEFADAPVMSLSAEYIRKRIFEEKSVRYLILESVRDYINEHRLYKDKTRTENHFRLR